MLDSSASIFAFGGNSRYSSHLCARVAYGKTGQIPTFAKLAEEKELEKAWAVELT